MGSVLGAREASTGFAMDAVWIEGRRLGDMGAPSHGVGQGFSATISDLFYKYLLSLSTMRQVLEVGQ